MFEKCRGRKEEKGNIREEKRKRREEKEGKRKKRIREG